MKIWCVRVACWIPKATNTHSEYVIVIAFLLQQWLHERASMLRCTCIDCYLISSPPALFTCVPKKTRAVVSDNHTGIKKCL